MALQKCPRCELNYILDGGKLCSVCREEVHGKAYVDEEEPAQMCSVCGEYPAVSGEDMCKACLAEFRSIEGAPGSTDDDDDDVETAEIDDEPLSSLDEIESADDLDDAMIDDDELASEGLDLDDEAEDDELLEELAKAQ